MYKVHGEVFLDTFIGYHNLTRFAAPEHPGQNSLVFFIPVLLAAMMPWTVYLGRPFGGCLKRGILFATRSGSVSYGPGSSFSFLSFKDPARHLYRPHVSANGVSHRLVLVPILY